MKESVPAYFHYWGKTSEDGSYHLLPYHCLDVAAVGAVWWDASSAIRHSFRQNNELLAEKVRAWLLFFCALHDYGKYDLRFQRKDVATFNRLYEYLGGTLPSERDTKDYWHGEAGLYWFYQDLIALYGMPDSGEGLFHDAGEPEQWLFWKPWIEAVTGHHGHLKNAEFVRDAEFSLLVDKRYKVVDHSARAEWLNTLEGLFLKPVGLSLMDCPPVPSPLLAGFCSVADWLGSRCDSSNFSFLLTPESLKKYFEDKVTGDAQRILELSALSAIQCLLMVLWRCCRKGKAPGPCSYWLKPCLRDGH